jgi:hypothetical protein
MLGRGRLHAFVRRIPGLTDLGGSTAIQSTFRDFFRLSANSEIAYPSPQMPLAAG